MNNYKFGVHIHTYIHTYTHTGLIHDIHSHVHLYAYKLHDNYRAIRDTSVEDREQEDNTSAREHS